MKKQEDPLSLNLYTYSHNNPLKYVDPSGHIPIPIITAIIGGVANLGIHLIGDIIEDGKINNDLKSYIGATVEGTIIGGGFGFIGANTGSLITGITAMTSGTIGSVANQYISIGNVDIKQSLIDGATLTASTIAFGVGGEVTTNGIGKYGAYGLKGFNATGFGNLTNQILSKGITNIDPIELGLSSALGGIVSSGSVAVSDVLSNIFGNVTDKYFLEWLQKGENNFKVYKAYDKEGNKIYTGITKQELNKRLYQHNGKEFKELRQVTENLTRNQARSIEQFLIEKSNANKKIL